MLESLYENDPTLLLNETFNSQNTVRWTIVGTPTFSNGKMTTSEVGNYINSIVDFSGRNKFTVRIKGTFATNKSMWIWQWDSATNRIYLWTYTDGRVYFVIWKTTENTWYIVIIGWTYDIFFVYDWSQSTNATKAKIYVWWVLQTLTFVNTIPTSAPILTSKNSRIGNAYLSSYLLNDCTFEQVQIWNRVLWDDEILARTNNSIYKNYNPIMNLKKWIKGTRSFVEKYNTVWDSIIALWQKYFIASWSSIISYPSKWANWTCEFSFLKWATANINVFQLVNSKIWAMIWSDNPWYRFNSTSNNLLVIIRQITSGTTSTVMSTANNYININTWYRIRITRSSTWAWTLYIKWWVFTNWTLVSTSWWAWTNPATDNIVTSSVFFTLSFWDTDCISDLRFYPYIIS